MRTMTAQTAFGCFAVWLLLACSSAAEPAGAASVDFAKEVKPILEAKCAACHGALKQQAGLRLDAGPLVLQGGDNGPVVVPRKPAESLLWRKVSSREVSERMPPEGEGEPLSTAQLATIKSWIDQGAVAPSEPTPPDPRSHWAYQPPRRPAIPRVKNAAWVRNPIDAFIAAGHERHGLRPLPEAPPEVLLRRLHFDLVGLPPIADCGLRIAEVEVARSPQSAICNPQSASDRLIDSLLASPRYGERWGRHWMDIWRYSDWTGYGGEVRYSQPHIWRWRDWIVASLNADRGYDQMIQEMLAGDELSRGDPGAAAATGFLVRNWYKFDRNSWLDDAIEHTAKAFLGVTLNCARCHDHKYDPITQEEYYRFRAIFEPHNVRTDPVGLADWRGVLRDTAGVSLLDTAKNGRVLAYDAEPKAATHLFIRGDFKRPDKSRPMSPGVPAALGGQEFRVEPVRLPPTSYYPALRDEIVEGMLLEAKAAVAAAQSAVDQAAAGDALKRVHVDKQLTAARARLISLEARIAAERAKHVGWAPPTQTAPTSQARRPDGSTLGKGPDGSTPAARSTTTDDELLRLSLAASKADRLAALAVAEEALAKAELDAQIANAAKGDAKAPAPKPAEAEKKLATARQAVEAARQNAAREDAAYSPLGPIYPAESTGRRAALARWIADRRNPLTARVAVNHVWARHFGRPLMENVVDFGLRSPRPEHADLLDYLAVELMESGWSLKHLHRLIVGSRTYRLASAAPPSDVASSDGRFGKPSYVTNQERDPDNRFFWRANARRLEAEAVRDAMLHLAGTLDSTMRGPDIDHSLGLTVPRRSLYFRHARERQMGFLLLFDAASPQECYRRRDSILPQQALVMVNSTLAASQARLLARHMDASLRDAKTSLGETRPRDGEARPRDRAFAIAAFEAVLCRRPSEAEVAECAGFLQQQAERLSSPGKLQPLGTGESVVAPAEKPDDRARENLVLVLLSHHEFVTVR